MLIQCTKALLDKIGIKESELASPEGHDHFPDRFMAWNANFVSINRRKAIILMNNETRFPIVIYRPAKKDFSNIKDLIREAISEALRIEGVRKEIIEAYFKKAGKISFSKTADRSMTAKLNHTVRKIESLEEFLDKEEKVQRYISLVAGRWIQQSGENEWFYPVEKMLECLGRVIGLNENPAAVDHVLDIDLYQLKIQINLEGHDIWRRVLVPSTYSFRHLHNIIQTVFDWQNCHLHEFTVERAENKPIKIVMDDDPETMEYLDPEQSDIRQERFVALEEIFPKYAEVIYEYDFGDSWEHVITLEKTVKSHEFQAAFLEGKGERPPEDVGGEPGFEEYIRIMANENDPEFGDTKEWAESQKERKLTPEQINQRLKHAISGRYSTYVP
jgi:hypothetical protein